MSTSIVTGGAGFVGSHLVDALVARGESVIVVDNLSSGRLTNLEAAIGSGRATLVYADIGIDRASLRSIIDDNRRGKVRSVYHLAVPSEAKANVAASWEKLAMSGLGTTSLIEIALAFESRFVLASTTYSRTTEPELFGETAVVDAIRTRQLDGRIARLANVYGPRMQSGEGRLIPALCEALVTGQPAAVPLASSARRAPVYVKDAIEALLRMVDATPPSLQPVVLGGSDAYTVFEIAEMLAALSGKPIAEFATAGTGGIEWGRDPRAVANADVGVIPCITALPEGLRSTYDWFAQESPLYV